EPVSSRLEVIENKVNVQITIGDRAPATTEEPSSDKSRTRWSFWRRFLQGLAIVVVLNLAKAQWLDPTPLGHQLEQMTANLLQDKLAQDNLGRDTDVAVVDIS